MTIVPATLRGRLALSIFLLVAALAGISLLTVERLLSRELARELGRSAEAQLRYIEGVVRHHERGEDAFVREEMAELEARSGALIDIRAAGRPMFTSAALAGRMLPDRAGAAVLDGTPYQVAASETGPLRLRVALPATSAQRMYRSINQLVFALLACGLVLAGVIAHVIAGRVVGPLDAIATAAERIHAESLSKRLVLPARAYDEVSRLAASFNQMLERLEAAIGRLRRFTADAAHELRTPLTGMKAQVQSALAIEMQDEHARSALQALLAEVNRLAELVERLLVLSRVDAESVEREPLDFSDLVVERVESGRALAEQRSVQLTLDVAQPIQLLGDAVLLRQVVDNLLGNALKFTLPHGHVRVTLRGDDLTATLTVADTGIGISPAALPQIFDRFFRGDSSRARDTGGAGLGLAIVARVIEAHDGEVKVISTPASGAVFEVKLPRHNERRVDRVRKGPTLATP